MAISYPEHVPLTCPRCQTPFSAEIYIIVDGVERPDLAARILDDTLHDAACPKCGQVGRVPAPMLYHDSRHARVLLGVPANMPEADWREVGQTLLWTLIGALPEAARLPYLGDVQAEAGLAGVAQVITREGLVGSGREAAEEVPPIVIAIRALLEAEGAPAMIEVLDAHPILNEPQSVTIMQELAAEAEREQQPEAVLGFRRAAELLAEVKRLRAEGVPAPTAGQPTPEALEALVAALLRSTTGQQLAQVVDDHPELLDDHIDAALERYVDEARGGDRARVADALAERLAAIHEMRSQYRAQQPVLEAIQAYLQAATGDEIEAIVLEREELTTDAADQALERLAAGSRADGDEQFARFVEERRAFLRQVRAALEG